MKKEKIYIGSDFDSFLKEEGILEHSESIAIKRVIAYQIQKIMKERHISKTTLAKKMNTSRSAIDRLFDPVNESITLQTLNRTASALGKKLKIEFV